MVPLTLSELAVTARKIRREAIKMIYYAGSGHPGGSLSVTDILSALYFGNILKFDPRNPTDEKRDRFILSSGHVAPAYYAVLAHLGVFNEDLLDSLRNLGSLLQGHPSSIFSSFVETSTGSLGQGLSVGVGVALSSKFNLACRQAGVHPASGGTKFKVVVLSSDGEQNEGSHWEAVMFAGHHYLDNLNLIIDQNGMQIGGKTINVLNTEPLADKYKAFGWRVYQADGHDFRDLLTNFSDLHETKGKPKVVICRTIRGKGVSFMEGEERYHACTLTEEEYLKAMGELS